MEIFKLFIDNQQNNIIKVLNDKIGNTINTNIMRFTEATKLDIQVTNK